MNAFLEFLKQRVSTLGIVSGIELTENRSADTVRHCSGAASTFSHKFVKNSSCDSVALVVYRMF